MLSVDYGFAQRNSHQPVNNTLIVPKLMAPQSADPLARHKPRRMANLSTTLPIPILESIDELVHEGKVPSRSYVIREAVRNYLETLA